MANGEKVALAASDLLTAEHLGRRLAVAAHRWLHGRTPSVAATA